MAEKVNIELEIKDNVKSLKAQLREAQNEVTQLSEKFGATSKEAVQAAKRAAELKDAIGDAKALTDAFNPDAKFNALSSSIGGVLNGFQAFEGALGLVGVEGEAVQETLLKVQSAMAVSQGIQGLMEAKDSFKQLGAVAVDALKGIRTGVAATGIGVLLVAVGTLVAYWDDIKEAMSGVSEEQEKLNEQAVKNYETAKESLQLLNSQDNILKLQGKSEREILQIKIKKTQETINEGVEALKLQKLKQEAEEKAAIENYSRAKKIADFFVQQAFILPKLMLLPIDMAIKGANKVAEILGIGKLVTVDLTDAFNQMTEKAAGWIAGSLFNVEEIKTEGAKTRKEIQTQIDELKNARAGYQLSIQQIDKEAADKRASDRKQEADKAKQDADKLAADEKAKAHQKYLDEVEANDLRLKRKEEQFQLERTLTETAQEKEIEDLVELYDSKFAIADGNAELEKKLEESLQNEITAIRKKYADIQKQNDDKEEAIKQERIKRNKEFAIQSSIDTFQTIADVASAFAGKDKEQQKKAFQIQKAANIAKATVETYKSATGAYASQLIPGDPTSPIRATIAAAIAVAAGIANVKKIASTQFDAGGTSASAGGSMGSGATGGGAITTPANFNIVGNAGANPLAGLNQPIQAYVVSGQITSAQELDRKQISYSSFP